MDDNLSVSWGDYQKNICKGLGVLQQRGEFVDMTLAADGHHVKVHQMVLSLVSPFIRELILSAACPHPVIFLNRVSYGTLQAILEYIYTGEVVVSKDKMGEFLEACKDLHIRGLDSLLQEAQTTNSNMFNEIAARTATLETDQENFGIQKNERKRAHQENINLLEVISYDDDYQQADDTGEVENETLLSDMDTSTKTVERAPSSVNTSGNTIKKSSVPVQYSVSCQGNLQVLVNRCLYSLRHTRKNDQRYWRCISQQKTGCPAIVTTAQDTIIERLFPHNHPFHDNQILKRVKTGNMFKSLNEVEDVAAAKRKKKEENDLVKQALAGTETE